MNPNDEENEELLSWPCQHLHGGRGTGIYSNINGKCKHPECNPRNDDRINTRKPKRPMIDDQIKRRVWAVCCVFTCLFFLLLIWSLYGCMDSQDQEKIMVDDVRIFEILPDGTKIDVTDKFPPSLVWEAKEKEATP